MEKINIAELLKGCPRGMELDCTMYDKAYFEQVDKNIKYPIVISIGKTDVIRLTKEGCWNGYPNAKCVIFPKGKTTWEGFHRPFVEGDIVSTESGMYIGIVKSTEDNHHCYTFCSINNEGDFFIDVTFLFSRFASENEKAKLFQAIKAEGYRWDAETKTLKKLPQFKIGDQIVKKNGISNSYIINSVSYDYYGLIIPNNTGIGVLRVDEQDDWELISRVKPVFKKGDKVRVKKGFPEPRIARIIEDVCDTFYTLVSFGKIDFTDQDNWELVPDKFNITTLEPFTKVLVRDFDTETWEINFFSRLLDNKHFKCLDVSYVQCIPYEGNEYLRGTTNTCSDFYKTWE